MKVRSSNINSRVYWLALGVICYILIFLATRLINLTTFPLIPDEGRHIARAQATLVEGDFFIGLRESLKQLYIWVVAVFLLFFNDKLLAGRLVSVLAGLGGAGVCYKLAGVLYPERRLGYIAALFYLLCPFALFYDRLALTDSLLTMLMGLSLLLSVQLWRTGSAIWAVALGVVFSLAALTKAYAAFFYPTPILLWFLLGRNISWGKLVKLSAIVYGITVLAWLPILLIGQEAYWQDHIEKLIETSPEKNYVQVFWYNLSSALGWLRIFLTWPLLALFLFSMVMAAFRRDKIRFILVSLIFTPIIVFSLSLDAWSSRYILPVVTPISLLIALGVDELAGLAVVLMAKARLTGIALLAQRRWVLQASLFLFLGFSALWSDYMIITNPAQVSLPPEDKLSYVEGRFSGYGLKESAQIIDELAKQYPKLIVLRGAYLLDTIFSLDVVGMLFYISNPDKVQIEIIDNFDETTLQKFNAYAQQAPTFTLRTTEVDHNSQPVVFDVSSYPQAWPVASFLKPGERFKVTLYQWLLPADFALRWAQQGGDPDPHVAWQTAETLTTTRGGELISWPVNITPESWQPSLAQANVEYVLATPELVSNQPELFEPFMTTEGTALSLKQLPPDWRLAFAYPDIYCRWCLFQVKPPGQPTQVSFGQQVVLAGYDISASKLRAGEALYLTLYWDSLGSLPESYIVFVHLVDANGNRVGQVDEPPLQGKWPTNRWRAGDKLADRHRLELNPTLASGDYTVLVGLYHPATLERLPVSAVQGQIIDNAVVLTTVSVDLHNLP